MLAALILGLELGMGTNISESCDVSASAGFGMQETVLTADVLAHFYGWELYDRYFGYSAFDPYLSVGAKGWIGSNGAIGPKAGVGVFYHLDDHWSLKADADATLAVDQKASVLFSLSVGVHYAF